MQPFLRRSMDLFVAGAALLVLAIPLLIVALAVRWTSPGPAFFLQRRVGRGGRLFWMYKFRTMRVANAGPQVTAGGDARITPLGKFLRRLKIDELPQLFNVFKGDMTLIGPRPEVERYVLHYTEDQRRVLDERPGLAGLAQLAFAHEADLLAACHTPEEVEAAYIEQIMPRKLDIDLAYARRRTLGSDLRLIVDIALSICGVNRHADRTFQIVSRHDTGSPCMDRCQTEKAGSL